MKAIAALLAVIWLGLCLFWAGLKDTWKSAGWIIVIVLASFGVCVALIEVLL